MYKRLYGTREGRNVVLNPVPSHLSINGSDPLQNLGMIIVQAFTQIDDLVAISIDNRLHDRSHVPVLELAHSSVHSFELVLEVDPPLTIFFTDK